MIRYPAFTAQPAAESVASALEQRPELLEAGIHLIVTQLPQGDLIVGDTHAYGDTPTPFREERLDELLLGEARRLLGATALEVRERWIGIYPTAADGRLATAGGSPPPAIISSWPPRSRGQVVEVTSGLGMTMALGYAAAVLDSLE